jgi:hypothetical protein
MRARAFGAKSAAAIFMRDVFIAGFLLFSFFPTGACLISRL